jgi:hypothetical protein
LVPGVNSEADITEGSVLSKLFKTWTKKIENDQWMPEKPEKSRYNEKITFLMAVMHLICCGDLILLWKNSMHTLKI